MHFEIEPGGGDGGRAGGSGRARLVTVGALTALATALVIAGAALSAGSSASRSTITACVKKSSGAARIVSSSTKCKSSERRVTWKRIGPIEDGRRYGVTGTPAFFIDGRLVSGAQPFARFKSALDAALAG